METESVRRVRPSSAPAGGVGGKSQFEGVVTVTVVYAEPNKVWQTTLSLPAGSDVQSVLQHCGFAQAYPEYPVHDPAVGIFGRRCRLDEVVSDGDRLEIYRPLSFDPMESRRRRAVHRKSAASRGVFRPRRVRDGE